MSKKAYILRVWVYGHLQQEIGPLESKDAGALYWKWYATPNCGPELLENGRHMTIAEIERKFKKPCPAMHSVTGGKRSVEVRQRQKYIREHNHRG